MTFLLIHEWSDALTCPVCELRKENDRLKSQNEMKRKAFGVAWINGGMLNDTEDTTVITIDAKVSPDQKARIMDVLREFEQT